MIVQNWQQSPITSLKITKEDCQEGSKNLIFNQANNNYLSKFNGYYFCAKTIPYNYFEVKKVRKNEDCPENMKKCGKIDTLENMLCIEEREDCPINYIRLNKKENLEKEFTSLKFEDWYLILSNKQSKLPVLSGLIVDSENPCHYFFERKCFSFDYKFDDIDEDKLMVTNNSQTLISKVKENLFKDNYYGLNLTIFDQANSKNILDSSIFLIDSLDSTITFLKVYYFGPVLIFTLVFFYNLIDSYKNIMNSSYFTIKYFRNRRFRFIYYICYIILSVILVKGFWKLKFLSIEYYNHIDSENSFDNVLKNRIINFEISYEEIFIYYVLTIFSIVLNVVCKEVDMIIHKEDLNIEKNYDEMTSVNNFEDKE